MKALLVHFLLLVTFMAITVKASSVKKKVVCYFPNFAYNRPGVGQFDVENINTTLCTHLIYAFVGIAADATITFTDPTYDLLINNGQGAISRFNALKNCNRRLKTMAAIGGANEALSAIFSTVVNDPVLRDTFENNVVEFLMQYGFDGFDLDWEFPAGTDKAAFSLLIQELRTKFEPYGFILSAAVSAYKTTAETSYELVELGKYLDFINLLSYDYHGSWQHVTGHNAPLYARSSETGDDANLNIHTNVQYYIGKGVPRNKLILGVPSYGRTWTLDSTSTTGVGAPANNPGNPGPFTQERGILGYNEICADLNLGRWTINWDAEQKVPYAVRRNQWVSYDNRTSIVIKTLYAVQQNLGGVMMWNLSTDDFLGLCDGTKFPLLTAVNKILHKCY